MSENTIPPQKSAKQKPARAKQASRDFSFKERMVSGEKLIAQARINDGIYWKAIAVFVLAVFVALSLAVELGAVLAAAAVCLGIYAVFMKEILLLAITNKRVFARYGLMQVDVVDIHFDKIESVELERMLPGYLLGYASVVIVGTGGRMIVIPYVSNGPQLRRAYNELTLGGREGGALPADVAADVSNV